FPKLDKLAQWMGDDGKVESKRQVQRYIAELRRFGLLRVEKRSVNYYYPVMSSNDKMSPSASSPMSSSASPSASPHTDTKATEATKENSRNSAAPPRVGVASSAPPEEKNAEIRVSLPADLPPDLVERFVASRLAPKRKPTEPTTIAAAVAAC